MDPFSPLTIGKISFKNRLIMAPVKTGYGLPEGEVTSRQEAYYRRRAKGGVSAIIVEPLYIDTAGKEHPRQLGINSDKHIEGLRRFVDIIHNEGALAVAHLNHAGRAANPKASGQPPEAPSAVKCETTGAVPVEMNKDRIRRVVNEFADGASRAVEAGFDAIEIQSGLGYLIAQFLSGRTNLRNDEYGGSIENRYRFVKEVLSAVKNALNGKDVPLIARISASEYVPDGLTIEDAKSLAEYLEKKGVNALHVVSGSACDSPPWYYQHMSMPYGKNLEMAQRIRDGVNIPVIVAGRMGDPADIRSALNREVVDAVALGRPLVADPDLPEKMRKNRDDDVLVCGSCLQGCLHKVKSGEGIGCIVNPEVGHEAEEIILSDEAKKVVIVGGGPAGMQAALTAKKRGHEVVLFDEGELGGQFRLAFLPPGKEMMEKPFRALIRKTKNSGVELRLNIKADVDAVLNEHPGIVVLATGSSPVTLEIPDLKNVLFGEDVLEEKAPVGERVLIIGGGMVGLETADFLTHRGHKVTVVELLDEIGRGMEAVTRKLILRNLEKYNVKIVTHTKLSRYDNGDTYISNGSEETLFGTFDTVVMAVGTRSVNELKEPLLQKGIKVHVIGDAEKPRQLFDAIREGFIVGNTL
ncbi:FAD-dependent oxidoreductase [candidate division KSB1 bacterium]